MTREKRGVSGNVPPGRRIKCFWCDEYVNAAAGVIACPAHTAQWTEQIRKGDREYVKTLRLFHEHHPEAGADIELANVIESWRLFDNGEPDITPVHADGFNLKAFRKWKKEQHGGPFSDHGEGHQAWRPVSRSGRKPR